MTRIMIGQEYSGLAQSDGVIYINKFVLMSGYQTALPTNW